MTVDWRRRYAWSTQYPVREPALVRRASGGYGFDVNTLPVIQSHQLTKIYHRKHIAVNGVTVELPAGGVIGLLGPNGAGKTTLIRLMLGLHRATAGWIKVLGERAGPNAARLRSRIGYLPTNPCF